MICKNCGYDNEDNLFICQNCGYPLYDEDDSIENKTASADVEKTQVFSTTNEKPVQPVPVTNEVEEDEDKKKEKQTLAIIIVLAVVLVAIIVGIIVGIAHNHNKPEAENTTISDVAPSDDEDDNNPDEQTTASTTTTEAEVEMLRLGLTCNEGGEVEGDGAYELGENVTIIARPDDGYEFGGWYQGNKKVSENTKFTFTITENTSYKAVFIMVEIEETTEATTKPTTKPTTEATTKPTTEATTKPTTEATTKPTTEAPTEAQTEPVEEQTEIDELEGSDD